MSGCCGGGNVGWRPGIVAKVLVIISVRLTHYTSFKLEGNHWGNWCGRARACQRVADHFEGHRESKIVCPREADGRGGVGGRVNMVIVKGHRGVGGENIKSEPKHWIVGSVEVAVVVVRSKIVVFEGNRIRVKAPSSDIDVISEGPRETGNIPLLGDVDASRTIHCNKGGNGNTIKLVLGNGDGRATDVIHGEGEADMHAGGGAAVGVDCVPAVHNVLCEGNRSKDRRGRVIEGIVAEEEGVGIGNIAASNREDICAHIDDG